MPERPEKPEDDAPQQESDAGGADAEEVDIENDPAYSPDDEGLKDIKGG